MRPLLVILMFTLLTFAVGADDMPQVGQDAPNTPPQTRPEPALTVEQDGVTVALYFENIQQGRVGLVQVIGEGVTGVRARFLEDIITFFPIESDGYYGLLAVNMSQASRNYEFPVVVLRGETSVTFNLEVPVSLGGFIRQDGLTIPPDRVYLIQPEIERAEFARLDAVEATFTESRFWVNEGFQLPINSELTSPFGAFRTFNDTTQARHTGWDLRAGVGVPIMAMGAGEVAFAGLLDIRGNHVIIDHGYGVFSGYSHLSQVHVTRGQTVSAGQILGTVGNTGRSSGAHLHWEVTVNGHFVDSADFINMWLP